MDLKSDFNKKLFKSYFWSIIGAIIPRALTLVTTYILAHILGKEIFGELSIVRSTINMFTVFAIMGLSLTATKYVAQYIVEDKSIVSRIIAFSRFSSISFGLLFSLIIIFSSDAISHYLEADNLSTCIKLGAIILFFNSLNASQNGILVGLQKYKTIAVNNTVASLMAFPLEILGAYFWGINGAIIGFGVYYLVLYVINLLSLYTSLREHNINFFSYSFGKDEISLFWKFSLPTAISGFIVAPVMWFCSSMLIKTSSGFSELAIFEAANNWKTAVIFIPTAISQVIIPLLVNTNKKSDLLYVFRRNLFYNTTIAAIIALLLSIFSPVLLKLYGEQFAGHYWPLIILLISTVFMSFNNVIGQLLASKDRQWEGLSLNIVWACMLILFSYLFLNYYKIGALGLSLAYLCSYILHTLFQFIYLQILKTKL